MFLWFFFSHHPLCKNYNKEILKIHGYYICKGCTEVYTASFLSVLFLVVFNPLKELNLIQIFLIGFLSIIPSLIGNFYHFKTRLVKDLIRITLGIGLGVGIFSFFAIPDLISKVEILIFMFIVYYVFKLTRSDQIGNLCPECSSFSPNACESFRKVFTAEGDYSRILSDYIQKKLTSSKFSEFGFKESIED